MDQTLAAKNFVWVALRGCLSLHQPDCQAASQTKIAGTSKGLRSGCGAHKPKASAVFFLEIKIGWYMWGWGADLILFDKSIRNQIMNLNSTKCNALPLSFWFDSPVWSLSLFQCEGQLCLCQSKRRLSSAWNSFILWQIRCAYKYQIMISENN